MERTKRQLDKIEEFISFLNKSTIECKDNVYKKIKYRIINDSCTFPDERDDTKIQGKIYDVIEVRITTVLDHKKNKDDKYTRDSIGTTLFIFTQHITDDEYFLIDEFVSKFSTLSNIENSIKLFKRTSILQKIKKNKDG